MCVCVFDRERGREIDEVQCIKQDVQSKMGRNKKNVQIAFKIRIKYFSVTCCVRCLKDQKKIQLKLVNRCPPTRKQLNGSIYFDV